MKKIFTFLVLTFLVLSVSATMKQSIADDDYRQAVYGALAKAEEPLKTAGFGKQPIAIVPLRRGHDLLAGRLKNMLNKAGFICVEGKEDPMWNKILAEIEWSDKKSDMLESSTIVKFGNLKSVRILFECDIRLVDKNEDRVYAEIELRGTEVSTRKVLWGDTFTHTHYIGKDIQGIIKIDRQLNAVLKKNFADAQKSLTSPMHSEKMRHVKTITVIPLIGDINAYMTNMAIAMISQTKYIPKNPHIPSLRVVRSSARDGSLGCDAVFYGYVRSFHMTNPVESQEGKQIKTSYNAVVNIQFFVEDAKNGNILWSATVDLDEPISSKRDMTAEELKKYRKERMDAVPDDIKENMLDNWLTYLIIFGIIIGAIIVLILAIKLFKAAFNCNNVR